MFQRMTIWDCPSSVALFHSQSWWCASFPHSFKSSYMITFVRTMFQKITPRWRYEVVPQMQHCFQLLLDFTRSWNVFEQYCPRCDLNVLVHWLSFFEPHCPSFTDSLFNHLSLPLSWFEYCLFFLFRVHCIAPRWLNFSKSVEKSWCHFCQGFRRLNWCSSLSDNLPSGINSNISKIMSIQV